MTGNHGDPRREERVMRICSRAVEIDPYYAQAWALLAIAQSSLRYSFGREVDDGFAAAHTAIAIDPNIAEAHLPMSKRLAEPAASDAARAELEIALRLGPDSWEVNKDAGRFYLMQRDIEAATRCYERAVEIMETDFHAWAMLSSCYMASGDEEAARHRADDGSEAEKAIQQDPGNGAALGILAGGNALLDNEEAAREWISRALLIDPDNLTMRYNFACVLANYLKDTEGAIKMLETTLSLAGAYQVRIADSDTDFDDIRDDPRFQKMMAAAKKRHGIEDAPKAEPAQAAE